MSPTSTPGPGRGQVAGTGLGTLAPVSAHPNPGPGEVAFETLKPQGIVLCKLGATAATLDGGIGGWKETDRPGRVNAMEWGSLPTPKLTIPVLLDGLTLRQSVEGRIAGLYAMGRPPDGSARGTLPPIVRVSGMVPHGGHDWIIQTIAEGEAVWDGQRRIRWWAVVSLAQYVPLDVIVVGTKKSGQTATRIYVVRRGDTLGSIARDEMGAKTATAIAKGVATLKRLNGIRDAKSIRPNQRLKVPK